MHRPLPGDFRGDVEGEHGSSPSSLTECSFLLTPDLMVFFGECWSFHSFMTSWLQKASILGRNGEGGIRFFFEGDCSFDLAGHERGVTGRSSGVNLCGDLPRGGELPSISNRITLPHYQLLTIVEMTKVRHQDNP